MINTLINFDQENHAVNFRDFEEKLHELTLKQPKEHGKN